LPCSGSHGHLLHSAQDANREADELLSAVVRVKAKILPNAAAAALGPGA